MDPKDRERIIELLTPTPFLPMFLAFDDNNLVTLLRTYLIGESFEDVKSKLCMFDGFLPENAEREIYEIALKYKDKTGDAKENKCN